MSKRLQVLIDESEYRKAQQAARGRGVTLAQWVREVMRAAWRQEPTGTVERKLQVVRRAAAHSFPAPDVDQMLREIERGYLDERSR